MGKNRRQLGTLGVIEKGANFLLHERSREPLHIVLHEDLHGGAVDRTGAFDRHVHPAADRHVGAEENGGLGSRGGFAWSQRLLHSAIRNLQSAIARTVSDANWDG